MIYKKLKVSLNPYQMYTLVNREFRESTMSSTSSAGPVSLTACSTANAPSRFFTCW